MGNKGAGELRVQRLEGNGIIIAEGAVVRVQKEILFPLKKSQIKLSRHILCHCQVERGLIR